MRVVNLKIKNFMSIKDINLNLNNNGLHLVLGSNLDDNKSFNSNGSGKSGIFEALSWGLYSSLIRPEMTIDQVIRNDADTANVIVTIDPEDGTDPVTFNRTRGKGKSSITVSTVSGVDLFPADSVKDIQKYIDNWLGMDFRTFTNSVYFGKGLVKFFMSSTDSERKDLLDTILQIVSFDDALDKAKTKVKELDTNKIKLNSNIDTYTILLEEKYSDYKNAKRNFQRAQLDKEEKSIVINEKIEITKKDLIETNKTLQVLNDEISKISTNLNLQIRAVESFYGGKISKLKAEKFDKLNELKNQEEEHKQKIDKRFSRDRITVREFIVIHESHLNNINRNLSTLSGRVIHGEVQYNNFIEEKNKIFRLEKGVSCRSCKQIISEVFKEQTIKAIDANILTTETSIKEAKNGLAVEKNEYNISLDTITQYKNQLSKLDLSERTLIQDCSDRFYELITTASSEYESQISSIQEEISTKKTELQDKFNSDLVSNRNNMLAISADKMKLEQEQTNNKIALRDLEVNLRQYENIYTKLKTDRETYKSNLEDFNQQLKQAASELEKASFWVEAFGPRGIRSFIFENALPYLTERANYYSTLLTGGTVSIQILPTTSMKNGNVKEKLFVSAINSLGSNIYPGNSDGEKRRIDICILLALQDLISTRSSKVWNTVIFDEIYENLDKVGIQNVVELLRTYKNKSIYLISHSEDLKQYFDTAITIQKLNGISSLV